MSRHRFFSKQKFSSKDLDDEGFEEDLGSYGSPMSPGSRMYMYGSREMQVEEPEETDEELVSGCIQQIYKVLGKANVRESREDLEALVRDYNYSADAVVNHIINSGDAAQGGGDDDELFGLEIGASPAAVKPPPGFSGPPANAPITKGDNRSAMAQHFMQHPAEKGTPPSAASVKIGASATIDALSRASIAKDQLPADVVPFDFSDPSPDDVVLDKQKQAFKKGGSAAPAPTTKTGPQFVSKGVAAGSQQQQTLSLKSSGGLPKVTKDMQSLRINSGDADSGAVSPNRSLSLNSPSSSTGTPKKVAQKEKQMSDQKRAKLLSEIKQVKAGEKLHMNMVIIGHVDAGKSTLMGHFLYQTGFVSKQVIDKHEHEAKQRGKSSFHFAWVLDQHEEERNRGVTIDVATSYLETPKYRITILDAPDMITGTSQADCAILVVPAAQAEFERGWSENGQTREHALLARSLGVSQLIVAVNKMDAVEWDKTRFETIKEQLGGFLKRSGFKEDNVWFVPVSGLIGENLTKRKEPKLTSWYDGPSLIERVDQFAPPEREVDKPFRLTINDVFREAGLSIGGKVETGFFSVGDRLVCMPYGDMCTVKSIRFNGQQVEHASAGANVDVTLNGIEQTSISIGSVLCDPEQPVVVSKRFKAQILTFSLEMPLMRGQRLLLHTQNLNEPARLVVLHGIMEKGEITRPKPRAIGEKQTAVVEVATDHNICAELYSNIRSLGRFMLRQEGRTVAAGVITEFVDPTTPAATTSSSTSTADH